MSLISKLPLVRGVYRENFPLNKTNWFNVGGEAEIFYKPEDLEDLSFFLKNVSKDINITVLGVGSNIIIRDGGIDGVVIKLGRNFTTINYSLLDDNDVLLNVGAGCLNYNLAYFCLENEISGLEFLVGIPGSIGGGIAMNAGAYGSEFKDFITYVQAVNLEGEIKSISNSDMRFSYRSNGLSEQHIFTQASFLLKKKNKSLIKEKMDEIINKREQTQPIKEKTTGSTFANPQGYHAWKLIDEAGLRGAKIGGAQMSLKHCNFMINLGDATANDLESLGEHVKKKVYEHSGVNLNWEVKILGKPKEIV